MFSVQYRPLFQAWRRVKKAFKKVSPSLENWNIFIYLCAHFSDVKDYKVVFLLCLSVSSIRQWDRITENQLPNSLAKMQGRQVWPWKEYEISNSWNSRICLCRIVFFFAFLIGMKAEGWRRSFGNCFLCWKYKR